MALPLLERFDQLDLNDVWPYSRFVLLLYCNRADRWVHRVADTASYIVRVTGIAERSVNRCREDLLDRGHLRLLRRGVGARNASLYQVTIGVEPTPMTLIPPPEREKLIRWKILTQDEIDASRV